MNKFLKAILVLAAMVLSMPSVMAVDGGGTHGDWLSANKFFGYGGYGEWWHTPAVFLGDYPYYRYRYYLYYPYYVSGMNYWDRASNFPQHNPGGRLFYPRGVRIGSIS